MNFSGITHVIENPKGHAPGYNFSLVGSVHSGMLEMRKATTADVMGGRASRTENGDLVAWHGRKWETVGQILEAAAAIPEVKMCNREGCACRKLFPVQEVACV